MILDFPPRPRLFRKPSQVVEARQPEDLSSILHNLSGHDWAGFMSYEAGTMLEPALKPFARAPAANEPPLAWFAKFEEETHLVNLPDPAGAWLGMPAPRIARHDFVDAINVIQHHIRAGNVYQVNFTYGAEVRVAGNPLALYAQLKSRAAASWGAVVFTGAHWILSCSPELFFEMTGGRIVTRPMKGTAVAESDPESLRSDEKQRAENLMIVDLMRNDLARVSEPGSVQVPELFKVERYPTVLQMTSTVTSRPRSDVRPADVLRTMFPCGSVTGAPKIRAMEIIDRLEVEPRGPYTGSVGVLSGDAAAFNVAIRTLVMENGSGVAQLGLGSGIVADSDAESEWEECRLKGAFVPSPTSFELIETMRVSGGKVPLIALHLDRLEASARTFGFAFERDRIAAAIRREAAGGGDLRLRLNLSMDGRAEFQHGPVPDVPEDAVVELVEREASAEDFRLRHKTSLRDIYDVPSRAAGTFEILFVDTEGFLTEGAFTNIFVRKGDVLVTPPASRGLLPGVLRRTLLDSGEAIEADIHADELTGELFVGNALRGLIPATVKR